MLNAEKIENFSGGKLKLNGCIHPLRRGYWIELNFFPGGDAPKSFIALYDYERDSKVRKNNPDTWPRYIAKVGHKWYPVESINEFLFNKIGETLGLNIASSRLIIAGEQVRFLSRYFLKENESLEHGAQIFSGYMADNDLVEEIEIKGLARKFFTFQFAQTAIKEVFPDQSEDIIIELVKMLIYDAITGNNDRHFYNWGVITHIENKKKPIFAPIYDSARGLLWNKSEGELMNWMAHPKQLGDKIKKYSEGSKPKIGWEGMEDLNHFDLISKLFSLDLRYKEQCIQLINLENQEKVLKLVEVKFSRFYTPARRELIQKCLKYRFNRLIEIIST